MRSSQRIQRVALSMAASWVMACQPNTVTPMEQVDMGTSEDVDMPMDEACGRGVLVELDDQEACVYQQPIVIETGFTCPASFDHLQRVTRNYSACTQLDRPLITLEVERIIERVVEIGWTFDGPSFAVADRPVDILWVIDNSFSMCQEQKVLRDNFDLLIQEIAASELDFHIGVTTTHAPEVEFTIEPLAEEGVLQSTPQPVPGINTTCLRGEGVVGGQQTSFAPLRESLSAALGCLADPQGAAEYDWTDAQIDCALQSEQEQQSTRCLEQTELIDRNGDQSIDVMDLFPTRQDYREISKVLRAEDYRDEAGQLELARLRQDFACMSLVGTRGHGYEKGLRAAVEAVSLQKTGGAVGLDGADPSRPNHGLLREDANFALIFVTDENDCSHDGSLQELGNVCGGNVCEYYNSSAVAPEDSPLVAPAELARQLRDNLAESRGRAVAPGELFVASIHGTWGLYDEPLPGCVDGDDQDVPEIAPVCQSALGEAFSGDRYERFIRQFLFHFPNQVVEEHGLAARLDFTKTEPLGWMCSDTFAPALEVIGALIAE